MKENKEIAKKEEKGLSVINWDEFDATNEDIDPSDVKVPMVVLAQGKVEFIKQGLAKEGDYVENVTNQVLGTPTSPFKALVLTHAKFWNIEDMTGAKGTKGQWVRNEPFTFENSESRWDFEENGVKYKRILVHRFLVLPVGMGPIEEQVPHNLDFKKTNVQQAKGLCQYFFKMAAAKRPKYSKVIEFGSKLVPHDSGSEFYIKTWASGRDATLEEMQLCKRWVDIAKNSTRLKNVEESGPSGAEVPDELLL